MLQITKQGNSIVVEGNDHILYPHDGVLTIPCNSVICVVDESDIVTFRSASNYDVMFSGKINEITIQGEGVTKESIGVLFGAISNVKSGGGEGGGAVDSVNGKTGTVILTAKDLGAASAADLANKQDVIEDIDTIRDGAAKGATALQSYVETDPIWTAEKVDYYKTVEVDVLVNEAKDAASSAMSVAASAEGIASAAHSKADEALEELESKADKSEIPSLDGYATEEFVNGAVGDVKEELNKYTLTENFATINGQSITEGGNIEVHGGEGGAVDSVNGKTGVVVITAEDLGAATTDDLTNKQDVIEDLDTIREGAALGATAIQEHQSLDGYATESWVENQGYLTEHQPLKTINGESIVGEGDIEIKGGGITEETDPTVPQWVKDITEDQIKKWDSNGDVITKDEAPKDNIGIGIFDGQGTEIHDGGVINTGDMFYMRPLEFNEKAQVGTTNKFISFFYVDDGVENYMKGINGNWTIYNSDMEEIQVVPKGKDCYVKYNDESGILWNTSIFVKVDGKKGVYVYDGTDQPQKVASEDWVNNSGFITEETDPTVPEYVKAITESDIERWNAGGSGTTPNLTLVGSVECIDGQLQNFANDSYAQFPFIVDFKNKFFEINMCFTQYNQGDNQQNIIDSRYGLALAIRNGHFVLAMGSDGETWDMGEHVGTIDVQPNITYYVTLSGGNGYYQLDVSTDGDTYDSDIYVNDIRSLYPTRIVIGKSINGDDNTFLGMVNLNRCDLLIDGTEVWKGMDVAGIGTRLATDLSNIDSDGKDMVKQIVSDSYYTKSEIDEMIGLINGKLAEIIG